VCPIRELVPIELMASYENDHNGYRLT